MPSLGSSDGHEEAQSPVDPFIVYEETLASLHGYDPRALPPPSSTLPQSGARNNAGLSSLVSCTSPDDSMRNAGTPSSHARAGQTPSTIIAASTASSNSMGMSSLADTMSPAQGDYLSGSHLTPDTSINSGSTTAEPVTKRVISRDYSIPLKGRKGKTYPKGITKVVKDNSKRSVREVRKFPLPYSTTKDRDLMVELVLYVQRGWPGYMNHQMSTLDLASHLSDPANRQQREDYASEEQLIAFAGLRYSTHKSWHVHSGTLQLTREDKDGMEGVESTKGDEGKQPCYKCFLLGGYFRAKTSDRVKAKGGTSCYCAVTKRCEFSRKFTCPHCYVYQKLKSHHITPARSSRVKRACLEIYCRVASLSFSSTDLKSDLRQQRSAPSAIALFYPTQVSRL
jgi:hypothetical protein